MPEIKCPDCGEYFSTDAEICPHCNRPMSVDVVIKQKKDSTTTPQTTKPAQPERKCPFCAETIQAQAIKCRHCGEFLNQSGGKTSKQSNPPTKKNKTTAAVLALLFGGVGIHQFYLGKSMIGLLYLLFFWTWIPAIIALFESIRFFSMSESNFDMEYNGPDVQREA